MTQHKSQYMKKCTMGCGLAGGWSCDYLVYCKFCKYSVNKCYSLCVQFYNRLWTGFLATLMECHNAVYTLLPDNFMHENTNRCSENL